jgi:hypothetical protein
MVQVRRGIFPGAAEMRNRAAWRQQAILNRQLEMMFRRLEMPLITNCRPLYLISTAALEEPAINSFIT